MDVENLLGGTVFTTEDVAALECTYRGIAGRKESDLVAVASSHVAALATWFGWSNCRRLVRSGENGADLELLAVLEEDVAHRFGRVVIGSGDGIFAVAAARLRLQGCDVTVVSRADALSSNLARAASGILLLPDNGRPAPAVAYLGAA